MLYDIFKKTRKKIPKRARIIADAHEKNSLVLSELKSSDSIVLEIKSLKIADYLIGNTAIERKTTNDFISSMINKRMLEQLRQMQKYPKSLLIIEGNIHNTINEDTNISKALRGFILSISLNHNIPIIFTQDYEDTAKYLITLAKQQLKKPSEPSFHSRIPKTIKEQKQYILESFPNIGPVKAKKLLKKFKSLFNTFNATEEELKDILKNQAKDFQDILNS
jgi:Fanconi anemia group M protein